MQSERWDWTGIVGTGQSLSVGSDAAVTAAAPSYRNLKLSLGSARVPPFDPASPALSMVPLMEPIRPLALVYPSAYPANIYGQTLHTAMARQISAMVKEAFGTDYVTVHTVVGESGQPMSVIQKGAASTSGRAMSTGRAYAATLFEARAIRRLAEAAGKSYGVGAIVLTHGESDAENPDYLGAILRLQSDYDADLRAATGQTGPIPMLVSQQHSCSYRDGAPSGPSPSTLAQWQAGVVRPGDLVCSGPKYQYPYCPDHVHMIGRGYDLLGEKYGQVYFERVVRARDWQPLAPRSVERNGAVITVRFRVPVAPLVWDRVLPAPHRAALTEWAEGRGFEVRIGEAPLTIRGVAIAGDAIEIACAKDVPGGALVGYAATADGNPMPGGTARWGLLRDSDTTVGATTGAAHPNYAVAFQMAVP